MTNYLIVPGLGNSGQEHWQTYFENSAPNFTRVQQSDWDTPACEDWIKSIDDMVASFEASSIVLIRNSLGCSAIAHWAVKYKREIKGAMLVAPSDLEAANYTFPTIG